MSKILNFLQILINRLLAPIVIIIILTVFILVTRWYKVLGPDRLDLRDTQPHLLHASAILQVRGTLLLLLVKTEVKYSSTMEIKHLLSPKIQVQLAVVSGHQG